MTIPKYNTVSVANELTLIPLQDLVTFYRDTHIVHYSSFHPAHPQNIIPGSLKISDSLKNGIYLKKIVFECKDVSPITLSNLDFWTSNDFIAVYTDERGLKRMCGSPEYPLNLNYKLDGEVISITIEGNDTEANAFIDNNLNIL